MKRIPRRIFVAGLRGGLGPGPLQLPREVRRRFFWVAKGH